MWHVPDPAEQFANPYLAMGTTKREELLLWSNLASSEPVGKAVVYVDPDGEFITWSFHKNGFSIGVNFTPIGFGYGGGLNFSWGDGFSVGAYGEVGYRVGGTGFGAGATISQSVDYNFKHQTTTTTISAGAYTSFGPLNTGANVASSYDLSHGHHLGYSWGLSAGIGMGNERGGVGMFVGYGLDGWNFGAGGYYDPRVKFNELYVYLELETNGTYYDHYTYEAMEKAIEAGAVLRDVTTKFSDNPFITGTYNPETGLYSYKIKVPDRNRVSAIKAAPDAGIMDGVQKNGKYSFNSVNPVESAIIMTKRRYQGNYFNFKNFNTYQRRTTQGLRLRYFNLFGYTWFTL